MLYKNLGVNTSGHLTFCGLDTVELARKHGTPLYLTDENGIRERCRIYKTSMEKYFGEGSLPIYAGKALCFIRQSRRDFPRTNCSSTATTKLRAISDSPSIRTQVALCATTSGSLRA